MPAWSSSKPISESAGPATAPGTAGSGRRGPGRHGFADDANRVDSSSWSVDASREARGSYPRSVTAPDRALARHDTEHVRPLQERHSAGVEHEVVAGVASDPPDVDVAALGEREQALAAVVQVRPDAVEQSLEILEVRSGEEGVIELGRRV